jgi:hypothetical protein
MQEHACNHQQATPNTAGNKPKEAAMATATCSHVGEGPPINQCSPQAADPGSLLHDVDAMAHCRMQPSSPRPSPHATSSCVGTTNTLPLWQSSGGRIITLSSVRSEPLAHHLCFLV